MDNNSTIKEEQTKDIQPILYNNNADTENGNNFAFISRFNLLKNIAVNMRNFFFFYNERCFTNYIFYFDIIKK